MVEINSSDVINGTKNLRFDPEYFNRDAIFAQSQLESAPPLSKFVKDGYRVVYETTEAIDRETGMRDNLPFFLQSADISTPYINEDSMIYVSQSDWERYEKGRIKPGELLIEVKGKAEKIAIVPENFPAKTLVTGTLFKLSTKEDDQKYVLASFLLCKYGQALKNRLKTNLLVSYIAKDDLYSIPVPEFGPDLVREIKNIFVSSAQLRQNSAIYMQQAEAHLLSALGLEQWQPPEALTYERSSKDVWEKGRLDAEHFRPKYKAIWDKARQSGMRIERLEDLIEPLISGLDLREFSDYGVPYLRVGDVKKTNIDVEGAKKVDADLDTIGKDILLKIGDLLFTRKGSFGNAAVVKIEHVESIISTEIIRIRFKSEYHDKILPEYAALFFNSILGKSQSEEWAHGVAFFSITQEDLKNFRFPIVDLAKQAEVIKVIQASDLAQHQSAQLLNAAKRAVEIAIEDSEAAALAYLEQQTTPKIVGVTS